jgi:hypothetical protein
VVAVSRPNTKNSKNGNLVLKILKIYFQKINSFTNKTKNIRTLVL